MAEDEVTKTADTPSGGDASSGGKNPLVSLLLIINVIALGAVAYFQYSFLQKEAQKPDLTELVKDEMNPKVQDELGQGKEINVNTLYRLKGFTVNLAQGDGPRRYARLDVVLKMSNDSKKAEFDALKPQIRDTIITLLNSKKAEELLKKEGKNYLKEEIKSSINSFLVDGKVEDVFYVSFQIN